MLPAATVLDSDGGHVGVVVGGRARLRLWTPLAAWLRRIAAMPK
jgi:hypothetical protein